MSEYLGARVTLTRAGVNANGCVYRPHLTVAGGDGAYLGVCFVSGPDAPLEPGVPATVTIALVYPGVDYGALLVPGARFDVREGARAVGAGTVLRRWSEGAP